MSVGRHGVGRWTARLGVAALLVSSLLPIPNWYPSERSAPWFGPVVSHWLVGAVPEIGLGGVGIPGLPDAIDDDEAEAAEKDQPIEPMHGSQR